MRNVPWRNPDLLPYLQILDRLKVMDSLYFSPKGLKKTMRVRDVRYCTLSRVFCDGLPHTHYDQDWMTVMEGYIGFDGLHIACEDFPWLDIAVEN